MIMDTKRKEAWKALKCAVDKFYQTTGAEILVATTCVLDPSRVDTFSIHNATIKEPTCYGYGNLLNKVKNILREDHQKNPSTDAVSQEPLLSTSAHYNQTIRDNHQQSFLHEKVSKSLSDNFRTLRLNAPSQPLHSGTSGSIATSMRTDAPDYPGSSLSHSQNGKRKHKRRKAKKQQVSEELELDESFVFDEPRRSSDDDEDSDGSFDDSDDSDEDLAPPSRVYRVPKAVERSANTAFATSLPVNINLNWGPTGLTEKHQRFRDNQGPHPPLYNPPTKPIIAGHATSRAAETPQIDTMMASIQALARSVTDDSASIFGDRPRPRTQAEVPNASIKF